MLTGSFCGFDSATAGRIYDTADGNGDLLVLSPFDRNNTRLHTNIDEEPLEEGGAED